MRKPMTAVAGVALLLVVMVSMGQAGSGPRLHGSFDMSATIEANDIGIAPGTRTADVYAFKSSCGSGGCATVTLRRKSGGRNFKATLKRTAPGVYKGTEGPSAYTCVTPFGAPGQFSGDHRVKVTRSVDGSATKITDELKIHITGCTETFENAKLVGKLMG